MTGPDRTHLPYPLNEESYRLLRRGVSDDPATEVWINEGRDFAFISPYPEIDYSHYKPRMAAPALSAYKARLIGDLYRRRTAALAPFLAGTESILELGGGDGAYLDHLRDVLDPAPAFTLVEPDRNSLEARLARPWLASRAEIGEEIASGTRHDVAMMFHVFEHIVEPAPFLADIARCLKPGGRVILEVPSLDDPLLVRYGSGAYQDFYFQRQHPYVYGPKGLARVLDAAGFRVAAMLPFQRYGLENHLTWLSQGRPGGDQALAEVTAGAETAYIAGLEAQGLTDTILAVAEPLAGDEPC